ncbi:MAG: dual specificity protein phosphatase family protein [Candidatus Omnitrophota bacterium]
MKNKRILTKGKKAIIIAVVFLALAGTGWFCIEQQGNFHVVSPNKVYRSGQVRQGKLIQYIQDYKIKSVLNLRGRNENSEWWKKEVSACVLLDVKYYDLSLSSKREPTSEQFRDLLEILEKSPKPLLVHCEGGANRTGLASAIYLYYFEGYPKKTARRQLSFIYGHIPLLQPEVRAMDDAFTKFCIQNKKEQKE